MSETTCAGIVTRGETGSEGVDAPLFSDARIEIDGRVVLQERRGRQLALRSGDQLVEVRIGAEARALPERELNDLPLEWLFSDSAKLEEALTSAGGAPVRLVGAAVLADDAVAVRGSASGRAPIRIDARLLAVGDEASALIEQAIRDEEERPPEPRRGVLVGVVEGEGVVLADVEMKTGGEAAHRERRLDAFTLRLPDGARVRVVPGADARLLPERELAGAFGEIVDDPLAEAVLAHAPGDLVNVALSGATVSAGETVSVGGAVHEETVSRAGYRQSERRPARVDAEWIALGSDGERALARVEEQARAAPRAKREAEPSAGGLPVLGPLLWGLLGVALVAVGVFRDGLSGSIGGSRAAIPWWLGMFVIATAIFVAQRRRWPAQLRPIGRTSEGDRAFDTFGWTLAAVGFGLFSLAAFYAAPLFDDYEGPLWLALSSLVPYTLTYAGVVFFSERRELGRLIRVLRANSLEHPLKNGRFGHLIGTLESEITRRREYTTSSTTQRVEHVDASQQVHAKQQRYSSTSWSESIRAPATLRVRTADGEILVRSNGALFASARRLFAERDGDRNTQSRTPTSRTNAWKSGLLIEPAHAGDSVLVVGRVNRQDGEVVFAPRGPESLLLFAAPPGRSPRAILLAQVLGTIAAIIAPCALAGGIVWVLLVRGFHP